jgi:hypothetical protein
MASQNHQGNLSIDWPTTPINGYSSRNIDIRLLPALVPEVVRNDTAHMIGPELQAKIDKLKNLIDAGIIDTETSGNGTSFFSLLRLPER